ncbi:hypothetical protein BDR04DRAFT_1118331 [Suillus decipiens]|nr:hypothetical protein BDR04DRAFT_1118331 [Suillus decipiens]
MHFPKPLGRVQDHQESQIRSLALGTLVVSNHCSYSHVVVHKITKSLKQAALIYAMNIKCQDNPKGVGGMPHLYFSLKIPVAILRPHKQLAVMSTSRSHPVQSCTPTYLRTLGNGKGSTSVRASAWAEKLWPEAK